MFRSKKSIPHGRPELCSKKNERFGGRSTIQEFIALKVYIKSSMYSWYQSLGEMVKDISVRGFDSRAGQISYNPQQLANAAMFLRSCVAQVLSRGDGPRYSLHASV